jgi:hypothetical protein
LQYTNGGSTSFNTTVHTSTISAAGFDTPDGIRAGLDIATTKTGKFGPVQCSSMTVGAITNTQNTTNIFSSSTINGKVVCNGLGAAGAGTALVISAITNEVVPLTSSSKTKHNVKNLGINSDLLLKLKPVEYDYNGSNSHSLGFIAEDVQKVIPQVVNKDAKGEPYSLSYDQLLILAIDKIQKQQIQIDALIKRVTALEKK